MADESKDIKKLIKLQKQRPAFSRMISWEISQASQQQPVKKGKQKKKKTPSTNTENSEDERETERQCPDITETICDDSSEYETACEDEEEIEVRGQIGSEGQCDSISSDILDHLSNCDIDSDDEDDEQDVDELFMSCMGNDTNTVRPSVEPEQGRKRRLSKRQKRKRRDQYKEMYLDDLYNLGNLFDTTDEISDVFTDVLAVGPDIEIQHRVPTLVELCLKVNRRKQRNNSEKGKNSTMKTQENQTTVLPYGMKKLISHWGWSQKQLENQLSFFLNKVLPEVEHKMGKKEYLDNVLDDKITNPVFPKRSVWANVPYPSVKSMLDDGEYGSEKTPSFLFSPSTHFHQEYNDFNYSYCNFYTYDIVTLNNALWALCTTIDLMLPSQTGTVSATTSIVRVKRALRLRYKALVDVLFETALPYVMWARGKIAIATDMFRNLIEKETETDTKAMYLSEIARMHAIFGDSKTAEQFYRLATETALEECSRQTRDRCINEATEQKQILLASIYDTGVLDGEKALQSFNYWTGVKNIPTVRTATMIAGLDALLCYHLSHLPGPNLYDEAIAKLDKVTNECEYAYYYQSMLHALNGSSDMSTRLYRESRSCCTMTPGAEIIQFIGNRARNPWQPLIDLVNRQTLKVKPLQVIWRTNLQPPRLTTHGPMEGQVNSKELNLRMNEAGHVTGDIQMMMPPLRDISLNPYTGLLMIENQPSQTAIWTSACLDENDYLCHDLLVPTYRQIYSGEDGTTVHMIKPSDSKSSLKFPPNRGTNGPPCPFILHWTSPDGQVAKLNLHSLLKKETKERVRRAIENGKNTYLTTRGFTDIVQMKLFKLLDIAAEKNLNITENVITDAGFKYNQYLKRAVKKKRDKSGNVQKPKRSLGSFLDSASSSRFLNWQITSEPYIFGKNVLLLVKGIDGSNNYVIVNTENKDTFLSCNIKFDPKELVLSKQFRNYYTEEDYFTTNNKNTVNVIDKRGEKVLAVQISAIAYIAREGSPPVIIYPKVFGIHQERNSIWCVILGLDDEDDVIIDIEDKICWTIGSVYDELSDNSGNGPNLQELTYIGRNDSHIGKLLMANLLTGLAFINPITMEYVPINIKEGCAKHFEFTKDQNALKGNFEDVKILTEKVFTVSDVQVYRVAIGVENKVFVLEINNEHDNSTIHLEMICCIVLPGLPKEVCLVGKQDMTTVKSQESSYTPFGWMNFSSTSVKSGMEEYKKKLFGMLISFTQHGDRADQYYREHVFHFDFDGQLHSVLLCLSHGPRSFLPVYLHGDIGNEGQGEVMSQGGWHVYLRDGRDGIMCIRLH